MASLVASESFHASGRFVAEGTEVEASDPIVKGREHLFTAGEPVKVPAKKAPAKKAARART